MYRLAVLILLTFSLPASAERALVAVASNFLKPVEALVERYEADSGHEINVAGGSTGQHYAQIVHGAPFDVFLAADEERPALLEASGLGDGRIAYALGRLALYSTSSASISEGFETLDSMRFIAIANPDLAPYGRAAKEALDHAGLWDNLQNRIVQGQNIGQAFGMVASGNAEVGLVALSQTIARNDTHWVVPSEFHTPIRQEAILLSRGKGNVAAEGFLAYLASDAAQMVIEEYGYDRP